MSGAICPVCYVSSNDGALPACTLSTCPGRQTFTQIFRPDLAGLARKRASEPLQPSRPQAACDFGLFSDDAAQLDLVTIAQQGK